MTFSIVAADPEKGEFGIGVASKCFAAGSLVPWAKATAGAVATQSFVNTSLGWRGLELLERGCTPDEAVRVLMRSEGDEGASKRQMGIVATPHSGEAAAASATFTGDKCIAWAGGRHGPNYAVQGNRLAGESVVDAMEKAFLDEEGADRRSTLAERIYSSLVAGESEGGDSAGRQAAAILVVKEKAGTGGHTDRAIDIRVDDHADPLAELGRLLRIALAHNIGSAAWTHYEEKGYGKALPAIERAVEMSPTDSDLVYDLAVIRLAAASETKEAKVDSDRISAIEALKKAIELNPKLKDMAKTDSAFDKLKWHPDFKALLGD